MEKVGGNALLEYWHSTSTDQRGKIIEQIVQIEATLFSVNFPVIGSIYYKKELNDNVKTAPILKDV
ncbi:MAG: hypothetical protein Q9171_002413 [Xanthocarpia ochracea]